MNYAIYGSQFNAHLTHAALLRLAREHGNVVARAEFSGCEGCYIEVARWSDERHRWERYCFEKVFGGEHPSETEELRVSAATTAELFVREINQAASNTYAPLIHDLPDYGGVT